MSVSFLLNVHNYKISDDVIANSKPGDPLVEGDLYWLNPQKTINERRALYLDYCVSNSRDGRDGIFSEIARLEKGRPLNDTVLKQALDFYYWWDKDLNKNGRCFWTENHQIIFHSDELLVGQIFKDRSFINGKIGKEHMQHALPMIKQWMEWRIKFGFSEWLSNTYFEEDMMALLNLYDFAEDHEISAKARLLIDILMFEMALNSYHETFGSTHGCTFVPLIKGGRGGSSASTMKLEFGMGIFNSSSAMGAVSLAASSYRCSSIIEEIAADYSNPLINMERHSIDIDDAVKYGLSYDNELTCNLYWSIQDYTHPKVIDLSQCDAEKYNVCRGGDYNQYRKLYRKQIEQNRKIVNTKLDPHALTEVNIETYRTPDYLLSCAQDFRSGSSGYHQHIWQAPMGIDAVVFTTHPGSNNESLRPNYWAGNGILPRAAQYKNVVVCIYSVPPENPLPFLRSELRGGRNIKADSVAPSDKLLPFTHAYFPRYAFDEVVEKKNWIFARKKNG